MLDGKRIHLRALESTDLEVLFGWENDVSNWDTSGTMAPFSRFVLEQYLSISHQDLYTNKELRLVIALNQPEGNGLPIGCIDLFEFDPKHRRAGVGILIGDTIMRGKGYAGDALDLLIPYAFEVLALHQLFANIAVRNAASIKIFETRKFVKVGTKADWLLTKEGWQDENLYQLINKG